MLADKTAHEEFARFFHKGTKMQYRKGEAIVRSVDQPRGIYYITEGYVKAYVITKYGEENLLLIRRHDDIFPLIWALADEHRDITYQAMSDVIVWRIAKSDFLQFIKTNHSAIQVLVDLAIDAYRLHSDRVMNLEYRTVRERIASFLLTYGAKFGVPIGANGLCIDSPIRRQDMAASVNASRETASRELSALARHKYVILDGNKITIPDIQKLRELI